MIVLRVLAVGVGCFLFLIATACVVLAVEPDPDYDPTEKRWLDRYRWLAALVSAAIGLLLCRLGVGGI
jgi:hypothetical protein